MQTTGAFPYHNVVYSKVCFADQFNCP